MGWGGVLIYFCYWGTVVDFSGAEGDGVIIGGAYITEWGVLIVIIIIVKSITIIVDMDWSSIIGIVISSLLSISFIFPY